MNNIIKKVSIISLTTAIAVSISITPAFAASRVLAYSCPSCNAGNVEEHIKRVYEHDESFPCSHGYKYGNDIYEVYKVEETRKCDNCSYNDSSNYEDHVLKSCNGYGKN